MKILGRPLDGQNGHEAGLSLLTELMGGTLPEVRRTEQGKPYFVDNPTHFSISHTKRHVFCVISDVPIGIDAEETERDINLKLAEKILCPTELVQFRGAKDPRRALLTFWVLKEAGVKCTGEGLRGFPNQPPFSLDDPRVTEIDGCLVAIIEKE